MGIEKITAIAIPEKDVARADDSLRWFIPTDNMVTVRKIQIEKKYKITLPNSDQELIIIMFNGYNLKQLYTKDRITIDAHMNIMVEHFNPNRTRYFDNLQDLSEYIHWVTELMQNLIAFKRKQEIHEVDV